MIVDLHPTEDQRMIEDGVRDFLRDRLPVDRLRDPGNHGGAAEHAVWEELAGLGLFGLGSAEQVGGLGLGLAEEALVARAFGLYLVSPALLAQMAAPHLAADDETRAALIDGKVRATFANRLDESGAHLVDGDHATLVLLVDCENAILLPRAALGEGRSVVNMDETVASSLTSAPAATAPRAAAADRVSLLIAAYLTGISQTAADMAVGYAKTREQFGQPIGAFQAIKHQCADMAARSSAAEAQTFHAAIAYGHGLDDRIEVAAARSLASSAALANAKANIQIHGGMGFTAECDAHLFLKRAYLFSLMGSSRAAERRRLLGLAA